MAREEVKSLRRKYLDALQSPVGEKADWRTDRSKIGHGICPFCGRATKRKGGYCRACISAGFDQVHQTFGSTNGWDRRPIAVVNTRVGWRGRQVVGAKARCEYHH